MNNLLLFSDTFPYGMAEPFLQQELPYLASRFSKVEIVPLYLPEAAAGASAGAIAGSTGAPAGSAAATGTGAAAQGFAAGFASRFKGNSYVRDAVVDGGVRMGAGGGIGFVGRAFGGIAARNGATLTGESISSVASRTPNVSGSIGGEIADRSLGNYMPQLNGYQLSGTQITGGQISTTAIGGDV